MSAHIPQSLADLDGLVVLNVVVSVINERIVPRTRGVANLAQEQLKLKSVEHVLVYWIAVQVKRSQC